ncbi:MAG: hypothetical protein KKG75_04300, partial [Nanoarchaeota archaeon]|nr:hypothetical protein [Nanoarchaeota archaeon]
MLKVEKEALLLRPRDFKPSHKNLEVIGAFNPGALRLKNGDIMLYVRVAERLKKFRGRKYVYSPISVSNNKYKLRIDRFRLKEVDHGDKKGFYFKDRTLRLTYISHFRRVLLDKDGFEVKKIEQKPGFFGTPFDGELGIEDARITKIEGKYIMTYVALSKFNSISSSYAVSHDGYNWHKRGIIFRHQNKDCVLFPKKINNRYVAFNRPEGNFEFSLPHMWISFSKDLEHWGDDYSILVSKKGWDANRVGPGCPPILTKRGWLELYHGVHPELGYCMGAALFEKNNPQKLIARSYPDVPLLSPKEDYEKEGYMKNVLFPTGLIEE